MFFDAIVKANTYAKGFFCFLFEDFFTGTKAGLVLFCDSTTAAIAAAPASTTGITRDDNNIKCFLNFNASTQIMNESS